MFKFLGLNNIAAYVFIGLFTALVGSLGSVYYVWEQNIKEKALTEYNSQQLQQQLKDQQKYIEEQANVYRQQQIAKDALAAQNQKLVARVDQLKKYLNSPEAKKSDRPSSEVIKQTILQLQSQSK